jgi:hypothetical protein
MSWEGVNEGRAACRDERRRARDVVAIGGPPLADVLLQQAHARHLQQEHRHQQRRDQAPRAGDTGAADRDHGEPPPDAGLAEIVGMTGIAPESSVHHLAGALGRCLEAAHLRVADRLEDDAEGTDRGADRVERAERPRAGHAGEERRGDDPGEHRLQGEDQVDALQREPGLVASADRLIAAVLAVAPVAPSHVHAKAQRPGQHERNHDVGAQARCRQLVPADERRDGDEHRPHPIDQAGVAARQAGKPGRERQHEDRSERLEGDGEERRQSRLSNR